MAKSIRASFVRKFGEDQASAIECAASGHANGINSANRGDDEFKWAILICIGYQCFEVDRYRDHHGITASCADIEAWIKRSGKLASHNGDSDYLALFTGCYNKFMPRKRKTLESRSE